MLFGTVGVHKVPETPCQFQLVWCQCLVKCNEGKLMLKLLERSVATVDQRLILLAPPSASAHRFFQHVDVDPQLHEAFVSEMQSVRGGIYLEDGAIARKHLSTGGRHQTPEDENSWHLLMLNRDHRVTACVWYLEHQNTTSIERLRVRTCPLATQDGSRERFHTAVGAELARAQREGLRYAEVGGWAVTPESRCTSEGLVLALAAYSLGRISGGALGLTTATVRHASSAILRRLGGSHLVANATALPAYYDARYGCDMELLRFDSRRPSAKYGPLIAELTQRLATVTVIASTEMADPFEYPEVAAASASLFAA